ncbi:polysaccharide biosynthesis related protein [Shewanella hanedai]|uniref:Oligosaccharide flippase family protein n=1 Tax=Shewanella hanedai TaxID=25 RepID=A0A553JMK5_SHEHA|nr:polysaccharide biosynthesis C-terminal domain-containing protein [Shewanella hanedai]TRY13689.1 oligosaccharide flippase family protein [Shewanella hanedai]GGI98675.1 polysaccharide biosynthesis related protein [Shewanella hanedai]
MKDKIKNVIANSEHRNTAINAFIALFIRVLGAGMAFIFNLLVARHLGAEQSGYFFLAFALVMFLSAFCRIGFENTILRFSGIAAKQQQGKSITAILHYAFKYTLPLAALMSVLLYLMAEPLAVYGFSKPEMITTLEAIAPAIFGISIVTLLAMSLQAQQRLTASIPCQNIVHLVLTSVAILVFSISTATEVSVVFSIALIVSSIIFYTIWSKGLNQQGQGSTKNNQLLDNKELLPNTKALWTSAQSNWLITMMGQTVQWIGPLIAGMWLLAEDVAYLSVAMRIAMLTSFILMAINLVVAPKFAAFHASKDMQGLRSTALFSVRLLILSAVPIVSFMFIFPEFLMELFGEDFVSAAGLLQILVLGQFINVVTGSVGYLLTMSGHERDMRNITLVAGIMAVVLTLLLTKSYGVTGCAIATATSLAFQNLAAVYFVKKRLGFNTLLFWQKI